jgi:hypothetical protein
MIVIISFFAIIISVFQSLDIFGLYPKNYKIVIAILSFLTILIKIF